MLFVYTQCNYSWQLCLDGFPRVFYGIFQVHAGVTEELKYSLGIFVVYTQCYYKWQLCLDGFPRVFYGIFQVLAGVTLELKYSLLILVV